MLRAVRQRVGWKGSIGLLDPQQPVVIAPPRKPKRGRTMLAISGQYVFDAELELLMLSRCHVSELCIILTELNQPHNSIYILQPKTR